jgi:DNA-binding MarR family transcriptional regulator
MSFQSATPDEEKDFVVGVIQLANLFTRRLAPLFKQARITPQQWGVLTALSDQQRPATLVGIARKLLVSKQNMTGMIARLEELGLIARGDDPNDLRSSRVQLTRRGRQLIEKLTPAYRDWLDEAISGLDESEQTALLSGVARLIAKLSGDE